jgi:hypothetical protein
MLCIAGYGFALAGVYLTWGPGIALLTGGIVLFLAGGLAKSEPRGGR